jgi:hypothetical protein
MRIRLRAVVRAYKTLAALTEDEQLELLKMCIVEDQPISWPLQVEYRKVQELDHWRKVYDRPKKKKLAEEEWQLLEDKEQLSWKELALNRAGPSATEARRVAVMESLRRRYRHAVDTVRRLYSLECISLLHELRDMQADGLLSWDQISARMKIVHRLCKSTPPPLAS